MPFAIQYRDVQAAARRIAPFIHRTPVFTCRTLNEKLGCELFLKAENLQKTGSFKFRGATNAVRSLSAEAAARGVATHSSGNHAQAIACAARARGIPAYLVMPSNSAQVKIDAVRGYGGEVILCQPTLAARESTCAEVVARTGATFLHAFEEPLVMAGQGTAALELVEDIVGLHAVLAPVGGGGLLAGTAVAVAGRAPTVAVFAAEPAQAGDTAASLALGHRTTELPGPTIADGLRTLVGERTFPIIQAMVVGLGTCREESIVAAMRLVWQHAKLVIEPSAAVTLGALLEGQLPQLAGRRVGVILCGGNVDLDHLPWTTTALAGKTG